MRTFKLLLLAAVAISLVYVPDSLARRVIYRTTRKVIIHHAPPPPVEEVHVHVTPPPPPRVVQPEPPVVVEKKEKDEDLLGIGIRFGGVALNGHKFGLSTLENPAMAGLGAQLRIKLNREIGFELSLDYFRGSDGSFIQETIPVMGSFMYYFFADKKLNPYVLAGAGVHLTQLSYDNGMLTQDLTEFAMQAGGGAQIRLGNWAIHGDIRFLGIYKNLGSRTEIVMANGQLPAWNEPVRDWNIGIQFMAGVSYHF